MKLKDLFEDSVNVDNNESNHEFFKTYTDTKNWLDEKMVKKYKINKKTLVVDVNGSVNISDFELTKIPVKFGTVNGDFIVGYNPHLETLLGCPDVIEGSLYCSSTSIKNFIGLKNVAGKILANSNFDLISFKGLPAELNSDLSLVGSCGNINTLDNIPKVINGCLDIGPDFKLLSELYTHMGSLHSISMHHSPGKYRNILTLLYINDLTKIEFKNSISLNIILNAEIKRQPVPRKRNLLKVAQELSNAGFHYLTVM